MSQSNHREVMKRRILFIPGIALYLSLLAVYSGHSASADTRFEIPYPAAFDNGPSTGRVFVMISKNKRVESRWQAGSYQAANQGGKYPTVEMHRSKLHQDKSQGVIYLDARQREERRVVIREGLVYDHAGNTLLTTRSKHKNQNNYVMDAAGNFYLFDEFTHPETRHSSIFAGGPVAGAGNITIQAGRITDIDSDSGHYPSSGVFENVQKELAARSAGAGDHRQKDNSGEDEKKDKKGKKNKKGKKKKHRSE